MTYKTNDGKMPQSEFGIGQMTTLGQVSMDHGYRPDADWAERFKKQHDEAEARHAKDMAEHPEDYEPKDEEDDDEEDAD